MKVFVEFEPGEADHVFSGYGTTSSFKQFVDEHFKVVLLRMQQIVECRQYLAVSGAMRWPESQEAPIESITSWRVF
jgi:hypothetical protein